MFKCRKVIGHPIYIYNIYIPLVSRLDLVLVPMHSKFKFK